MRRIIVFVALLTLISACGDDDSTVTTGASSSSTATTAATTTTIVATTTTTTTTAPAATGFTVDDLPAAVLHDGDPWTSEVGDIASQSLTIDDIWPLDGEIQFPDERAAYEGAKFVQGWFAAFAEPDGMALVLSGAHLFEDAAGAATALVVLEDSFNDLDLVARITGFAPGSLNLVFPMPTSLGDEGFGMLASGPQSQVVGIVWRTDNLLQFVRIGMALGDENRAGATVTLAHAIADRMGR